MIIYKISNNINNKIYIGQTTKTLKKRWSDHYWGNRTVISKAIRKYGRENFNIEIIDKANSLDELNLLEQKYIKEFNSLSPNGYNLDTGGKNRNLSEETKLKISLSKKGKKVKSKTQFIKGQIPWNKGKSGPKRKYKPNPKISQILKGKSKTKEHRNNLSKAKIEYHKNHRHYLAKYVIWLDRNIIFESATEAAKYFNCKQAHISRVCTGQRKTYKGFKFQYIDLNNPALQAASMGNVANR